MSQYIERAGILVTRTGQISLRHNGQLRRIERAAPAPPAQAKDTDPDFWDVHFADGTRGLIGRPTMRGALMRRLCESDCSEI